MCKYEELVELLDEVGVLQLQDEWALQVQALIELHRLSKEKAGQEFRPPPAP